MARVAGRLTLYPLEMKDFTSGKPVFFRSKQINWVVAPYS